MTLVEEIAHQIEARRLVNPSASDTRLKPHLAEYVYWTEVAFPNELGGEIQITEELTAFSALTRAVLGSTQGIISIYEALDLFERTFHVPTDKDIDFIVEAYWEAMRGLTSHHFAKRKIDVVESVLPVLYQRLNCKGLVATFITGVGGTRHMHFFFTEASDAMAFRLAL